MNKGLKTNKIILMTFVIVLIFLAFRGPIPLNQQHIKAQDAFTIVAHRGASGYAPENTLTAFRKAVELEAEFIELDVQCSLDESLVVIHDPVVDRTTNGFGEIKNMALPDLKQLDAGSYFDPAYTGEAIPTLAEVIDEFGGKIGLMIELKHPKACPGIELLLANILIESGLNRSASDIIVQSFDTKALRSLHRMMPDLPLAVLVSRSQGSLAFSQIKEYAAYVKYINPHYSLVNKNVVDEIHAHGMKVISWTIQTKRQLGAMVSANVDGIITDFPDLEL